MIVYLVLAAMTRKYSGEFSHKNYASLFCEVFDSAGNFCALFHYRNYHGRPALSVDNLGLSDAMLAYELMNFLNKASIACGYPLASSFCEKLPDKIMF